jgi:hypothetical protein
VSTYQPSAPPQDIRQIPAWLNREMLALKQDQERAQPHLTWEYLHAEPEKVVAGMEALADGANWDPGSIGVAAKYRRSEDNTTWELIEAISVAAGLAAHLADTSDAHDASAISILDAAGDFTATDVEGALAELQSDAEADAQALADHIADATAAHAASAISFSPVGTIAGTDVQTAVAEVATDAAAALAAHEAAADPHPGYLTPAEGNAAYQPLDAQLTGLAALDTSVGVVVQTGASSYTKRSIQGTAGEISVANDDGSAGNPTISIPATFILTGKNIDGGNYRDVETWEIRNVGVGAFDMAVRHNGTLTALRTLTWNLNDVSRSVSLSGDLSLAGTFATSGAITIGANMGTWLTTPSGANLASALTSDIPYSAITQGSALSVLGVAGNAAADVASIAAANDNEVFRRSGTAVGFGAINLASASAVTGDLPLANLAQGSALSVLGVTGNATADNASIAAASDHQVMRRSGTAVAFGAVNLAQAAAVTGTLGVANGGTGITAFGTGVATALGANTAGSGGIALITTGSYTATATGMTTAPTASIAYNVIGNFVHCSLQSTITGTSNATTFTLTGAPVGIRPGSSRIFLMRVQDNGAAVTYGRGVMDSAGTITLALTPSGTAFTASGTKSVQAFEFSYLL